MKDNDIIKALECCAVGTFACTEECPCFHIKRNLKINSCRFELIGEALDLIKRQKAEIERLEKCNEINISSIATLHERLKTAKSEAYKQFAEKITEIFKLYAHLHSYADEARKDYIITDDGEEIEMQSVWDAITLKKNEMAEYDEINTLQANIETIAKERLLTELEKDFRLLVKEMTEGNDNESTP